MRVNLFIVGAMKSGTTSVYSFFKKNPQFICSSVKEPNYFAKDIMPLVTPRGYEVLAKSSIRHKSYVRDIKEYEQLFCFSSEGRFYVDASVSYLVSDEAAKRIHTYNSNAKIIMVLRHPLDRLKSHIAMDMSRGMNANRVRKRLALSLARIDHSQMFWDYDSFYIRASLYSLQVERYRRLFPRDNILILKYEDLSDSILLKEKLGEFLGEELEDVNLEHTNRSQTLKYPNLFKILRMIKSPFSIKLRTFIRSKFFNSHSPNNIDEVISPFIDKINNVLQEEYEYYEKA